MTTNSEPTSPRRGAVLTLLLLLAALMLSGCGGSDDGRPGVAEAPPASVLEPDVIEAPAAPSKKARNPRAPKPEVVAKPFHPGSLQLTP